MVDPASLDELAYNHHWCGNAQITYRDLKEYGMEDDVDELVEQMTDIYDEDVEVIQRIPGVTVVAP